MSGPFPLPFGRHVEAEASRQSSRPPVGERGLLSAADKLAVGYPLPPNSPVLDGRTRYVRYAPRLTFRRCDHISEFNSERVQRTP